MFFCEVAKSKYVLIFLHVLLIFGICSEEDNFAQINCLFDHYSTDDGLSHGSITDIVKDTEGFIWLATLDGVCRFDGYSFKTYKTYPEDSISLSNNRIDKIRNANFGYLWIKTNDSKAYRLDKSTGLFELLGNGLNIKKIFLASNGDAWLITQNHGVVHVEIDSLNHKLIEKHYHTKSESYFIPGNNIRFIAEDEIKDVFWISTNKRLIALKRFNQKAGYSMAHFGDKDEFIAHNNVFSAHSNRKNGHFFGTTRGDVFVYSQHEGFEKIKHNFGSPISGFGTLDNQTLIIATGGSGVFKYDLAGKKLTGSVNSEICKNVKSTFVDSHRNLWLETDLPGITRLNMHTMRAKQYLHKSEYSMLKGINGQIGIKEAKNGLVWISLKGIGFGYYNPHTEQLEYFYNEPGSSTKKMSNQVSSFYLDNTGILWLSTNMKGLEKITFPGDAFRHKQLSTGTKSNNANEVRSIIETSNNMLWAGTKEGVLYLLDSVFDIDRTYESNSPLENGLVYTIFCDSQENYWFGTKGKGIFVTNEKPDFKGSFINLKNDQGNKASLSNNNIYDIVEDTVGNIWIATYGGGINLVQKSDEGYSFIHAENGLTNYPISKAGKLRQAVVDKYGHIWLGSNNGLVYFNPYKRDIENLQFKHFVHEPGVNTSLGNNNIVSMHVDKKGHLWIGTIGGGLQKVISYPTEKPVPELKSYTVKDGLPSDVVLAIQSDSENKLWLTTENGLSCFNPANEEIRNYDKYDGLTKTSFSEATIYEKKDGQIVVGAFDGLYYFQPDELADRTDTFNLVITNFSYLDKKGRHNFFYDNASWKNGTVVLKHDQNMFTINYIGLNIKNQRKLRYAYKLEGFEKSWHHVRNQRLATYTNIPPGNYTFKVRVLNSGMVKGIGTDSIKVIIKRPPWRTGRAYFAYLVLLIIVFEIARRIIFSFIRLRNKIIVEKEITNLKLRFFTNISHELRTPLTLISGPIAEIARNEQLSPIGKEYIKLLDKNASRMLRLINQLLDFRKLQNEKMKLFVSEVDIVSLIMDIASNFKELARKKNIAFNVSSNVSTLKLWLDIEKMDIVFFNLLSNAMKFTPQGKQIDLILEYDNIRDNLLIQVLDQGIGIPKENAGLIFSRFHSNAPKGMRKDAGTGIGLSLAKELVELHEGNLSFESRENVGTAFKINLSVSDRILKSPHVEVVSDVPQKKYMHRFITGQPSAELENYISETSDEPLDDGKPKLLVVEDDEELRSFMTLFFKHKYFIIEAVDGKEGVEKAKESIPDIIISDVMMPEMDGLGLTQALKNDFSTSHIPIVLLTAKTAIEDQLAGLKYGADDYITKPFDCQYLEARLVNIIDQRKKLFQKLDKRPVKSDVQETGQVEEALTSKDKEFLEGLLNTLEENYKNPEFKIDDLSKQLMVGRTKFFTKVKSLTGQAPVEILREYRLNKSLSLLKSKEYSISEIAFMNGFNDAGYFTKCFKEKYKTTPTKYFS